MPDERSYGQGWDEGRFQVLNDLENLLDDYLARQNRRPETDESFRSGFRVGSIFKVLELLRWVEGER